MKFKLYGLELVCLKKKFFKKVRVRKLSRRASTLAACSQSGIRLIWKVKMKLRKSRWGGELVYMLLAVNDTVPESVWCG